MTTGRWLWRYFPVLVLFSLLRLLLWLTYRQRFFIDLDALTTMKAFVSGVRFDLAASLMFLGPPLLCLLLLPRLAWLFDTIFVFVAAALVLLQSGDIVYFGYVGRHLADELTHLGNDPRYLVSEAFIGHPLAFGCTIVGLVALITC